ncbi:hypothetical protein BC628DRAFT_881194 [Trametes gibbosa]|nr:hypothetical protein BC628DRAFT_881194 [Trametes gibbosa]
MRHHASLAATLPSLSLASLFQAAAGKAWARTRPTTRAYHRTSVRSSEGAAPSKSSTVQHGRDGAVGGPSSSAAAAAAAVRHANVCSTSYAANAPLRSPASLPHSHPSPPSSRPAAVDVSPGREGDPAQASVRARFSRVRGRDWVTSVDVERLSAHDYEPATQGRAGPSAAHEGGPPWEDIRASVPESSLPRVSSRGLPIPRQLVLTPEPSTPDELLANLLLATTQGSLPPLGPLLAYHGKYAGLRSTASFNLLMRLAIRHASFGTVRTLLDRMVREGVAGDVETRTLRVRCMVRAGFWEHAWHEERERMRADGLEMPLPVWLEFFGSVKQGAIARGTRRSNRTESLEQPHPSVAIGRLEALLQHPPLVRQEDAESVPPRAVYALVRGLLAQGERATAVSMTTQYLQSLPDDIDAGWRRSCLSIIHLHLRPGPKCNLTDHYAMRETLYGFLRTHRSFRPTSATLFFLLRSLRQSAQCGRRAAELVRLFARRWGAEVVDDAVRRRVASFWLKEGNARRAAAVVEAQARVDEARVAWRAEKEAVEGDMAKDRARRLRWLDLHRPPSKGKEGWRWRMLRRRLWRAQVRRS